MAGKQVTTPNPYWNHTTLIFKLLVSQLHGKPHHPHWANQPDSPTTIFTFYRSSAYNPICDRPSIFRTRASNFQPQTWLHHKRPPKQYSSLTPTSLRTSSLATSAADSIPADHATPRRSMPPAIWEWREGPKVAILHLISAAQNWFTTSCLIPRVVQNRIYTPRCVCDVDDGLLCLRISWIT